MTDDRTAILDLLTTRERAIAAGDAAGAIACMADGAITYDLPTPLAFEHDRDGAIAGLDDWFDTWDGAVTSELTDPQVEIAGDLAAVWGLSRMRGTKKEGGPQDLWFRATTVLRCEGGAWRIVHEHNSVPMKMDGSGAAATDLQPDDRA